MKPEIYLKRLLACFFLVFTAVYGAHAQEAAITYSTETVAPAGVLQGTSYQLVYILKVENTSDDAATANSLVFQGSGTFQPGDLGEFRLFRNPSAASLDEAIQIGNGYPYSAAAGDDITLSIWDGIIPANSTQYYLITADITPTAAEGRTFKINGGANPVTLGFTGETPTITNSQTDNGGTLTITAPSLTYSTESVADATVLQGAAGHLTYILKVVNTGNHDAEFSHLVFKASGTFQPGDLGEFKLYKNSAASLTGADQIGNGYPYGAVAGDDIYLWLWAPPTDGLVAANSTQYYLITADIMPTAVEGRTFKIDGGVNPVTLGFTGTTPTITDSQTDDGGTLTITAPTLTYSTESVADATVLQGTTGHLTYILKVVNTGNHDAEFSHLVFKASGTFQPGDLGEFKLYKNSAASLTGADQIGNGHPYGAVAGDDIYLWLWAPPTDGLVAANSTQYYLITADIMPTAVEGRTFKIDGGVNPVTLGFAGTAPTITDSQTDDGGTLTFDAPKLTYSTEFVPPANILQGATGNLVYILKVVNTGNYDAEFNHLVFKASGTFLPGDLGEFRLYKNSAGSLTGADQIGNGYPYGAVAGDDISLGLWAPSTDGLIAANSTQYYLITVDIAPSAIDGRTFKIDGAGNSISLNYFNTTPTITNNQSDIAGRQTIGTPSFTHTTGTVPAKIIARGTGNHPFYILKVTNGPIGSTITGVNATTTGTYDADDLHAFTLYRNTSASISGATLVDTDNTSTGSGETVTVHTGYLELEPNEEIYFIIRADIAATATLGHAFKISGGSATVTVSNSGVAANVTDNQSDLAGVQTIGIPPSFVAALADISSGTDIGECAANVSYTITTEGYPAPALSYVFTGVTTGSGSGSGSGSIFNKGVTHVEITASNDCEPNPTVVGSFDIEVTDDKNPTVTAADDIVTTTSADEAGDCSVAVAVPNAIFNDNCPGSELSWVFTGATVGSGEGQIGTQTFNIGVTIITYTVIDAATRTATASLTLTVTDDEKPVKPTLADVTGECSVTLTAPTTTDNCAGTITGDTEDPLTYSEQGTYIVTWIFDDGNGNIETAEQTVIVNDVTKPVKPTLADATGECSVTLTAPTTTDNCAGTITGTTEDPLTYSEQGTYIVTWIFDDGNGNIETAEQTVIVNDVTKPVKPTLADATGECSVTLTAPTTTDNCAGTITGTTTDPLTYSEQGTYTVTWTFNDGNGNTETATQTVIVDDVTKPVKPTLATVTGECSATVTTPTTTDNCAGTITGTTTDPLTYSEQGTYTVNWTFDDGNGNTETATQTVIVDDVTKPVKPTLATVTGECSATVTAPTTTDNCAGTITGTTTDPLTYSEQGTYTITWTFSDGNGNIETTEQTVIVQVTLLAEHQDSKTFVMAPGENTAITDDCKLIASVTPGDANGSTVFRVFVDGVVQAFAGKPYVQRHYDISPATNGAGRITLYFTQAEFNAYNDHPGSVVNLPEGPDHSAGIANLRINQFHGTSGNPSTGTPDTYSGGSELLDPADADITWNGSYWEVSFNVTGFSGFFITAGDDSALPVTLSSFEVTRGESNIALLRWTTTEEVNAGRFDIERSSDAKQWHKIGEVKAKGNSPQSYSFTETAVGHRPSAVSLLYYRLKMVDWDGTSAFSPVRSLTFEPVVKTPAVLYPNPARERLYIRDVPLADIQLVQVVNLLGKVVMEVRGVDAGGIYLKSLVSGVYMVKLTRNNGQPEYHKLVIGE